MSRVRRQIEFLDPKGSIGSATVEWWSEPADGGWPVCCVEISLPAGSGSGTGSDVFAAFQNARVDLEKLGNRTGDEIRPCTVSEQRAAAEAWFDTRAEARDRE